MKKIKVIDLLNKIANGEEVPKKVKYEGDIYEYNNCDYQNYEDYETTNLISEVIFMNKQNLNEEVEIIEDTPKEDKKIERLDETKANEDIFTYSTSGSNLYFLSLYVKSTIVDKINEIIDKVNGDSNE